MTYKFENFHQPTDESRATWTGICCCCCCGICCILENPVGNCCCCCCCGICCILENPVGNCCCCCCCCIRWVCIGWTGICCWLCLNWTALGSPKNDGEIRPTDGSKLFGPENTFDWILGCWALNICENHPNWSALAEPFNYDLFRKTILL